MGGLFVKPVPVILSDWMSVHVIEKPGEKIADILPDSVLERDMRVGFIGYSNRILMQKENEVFYFYPVELRYFHLCS